MIRSGAGPTRDILTDRRIPIKEKTTFACGRTWGIVFKYTERMMGKGRNIVGPT